LNISYTRIKSLFLSFMTEGHERSLKAKRNILASFVIKGFSIVIGFVLVPLTIGFINPTRYGIWLTLSSFIGWFSFFDIGLGNGLRNKFAEAKARGDVEMARIYVSTTYAILTLIICPVLLIFIAINPLLNWTRIFNTPADMAAELTLLMLVVFVFFSIKFVIQLITTILTADQKPALSGFYNLLGNLISLIWIFILTKTIKGSLLQLGTALSVSPVLVLLLTSFILFSGKYKQFSPSLKYVRFRYSKGLMNIGLQFFIIQLTGIIVYSSANMIIAQLFGPAEVTPYNLAYRLMGVIAMIFGMIQTPFWSAYTEAYYKNDIAWIKRATTRMIQIWIVLSLGVILLLAFSPFIYKLWIGNKVIVPFQLSLVVSVYFILSSWNGIFVMFLNGVGKIRLQLFSAIAEGSIFIPLALLMAKVLHLGITGIVLTSCIPLAAGAIWTPIQFRKIISKRASGIWNK
jgi:O-antigen/teichoic acid export membrane protein